MSWSTYQINILSSKSLYTHSLSGVSPTNGPSLQPGTRVHEYVPAVGVFSCSHARLYRRPVSASLPPTVVSATFPAMALATSRTDDSRLSNRMPIKQTWNMKQERPVKRCLYPSLLTHTPSSPPSVQSGSHRPVKKSRYTTIYDEMLRPLDPSVVLPVPTSCTSVTTVVNSSLQQQFNKLLSTADTVTLEQFLTLHGENVSINQYSKDGLTPLQEICQEGGQHALDKARILVTHGADTRLTSRDGWSPLHLASFSGNTPLMMFMLKCPK